MLGINVAEQDGRVDLPVSCLNLICPQIHSRHRTKN